MERNKGNNILDLISDYTVIDLETTGYDPNFDEIIELGAVRVRDSKVTDSFQQLVKPSRKIDNFITELTGITNEMLSDAPGINSVLPSFIDFIGSDVIVGHNVNFDINFIYDNYLDQTGKEFQNDYIDTLRLARKVLPELDHHRLKDLRKHYGVSSENAHRSLADCTSTHEIYLHLIDDVKAKGISLENKRVRHSKWYRAADILATITPDEDSPIFGQMVVFTGTLERMVRKDAMQLVVNLGGINGDGVTKKTNLLVLGNGDYSCALKDGKSNKHKKAEELISKGADLKIISEDVFFDLIEQ